ncbi:uncharacterized protein [Elaeis guineensis]|uniref:Uncharacterized protein LOC105056808 n=1 Tax=Elaeis guineensis var. tenera TaxID=51953 RepID=A0A6I9S5I8_ELAGV|nr:uncharacterized protein LOC105056808 [Elaeis guineensis]
MATELIPVVDLRLLSQAELNTLSLSCPNAFDPRRCDDIVVPKIDRSVFNESAGSRKQTYSRLRLAPRKPDGPPSSSSSIARRRPRGLLSSSSLHSSSATAATDGAGAEGDDPGRRENQQIVSFLRQLFAREDSAPPPQLPSQSQTLAPAVATPICALRNHDAGDSSSKVLVVVDDKDREVLNAKGEAVDLVGLGEKVDPFGEELRRRTAGLEAEELLRFLSGLEGQWGSRRKRRKIVDASVVGDDLPRGWKLLLELNKNEGVAWLNCRRYVSPNGKQFVSCKEVSSYILSLIGHPNDGQSVSVRNDGSTCELDKLTPRSAAGLTHQEDITGENCCLSSGTPIASYSANNPKQVVLYRAEKQTMDDVKNILECHACNLTFGDKDTYLQHQLLFHQRSAKRRRLGKSIGDGVIVKDGKYECQFCHKTFNERPRYNGHIGAHVRYQGLSAEALSDNIMTRKIFNPSPIAAVPYGLSETDLAKQNEETCNAKSADELHVDSFQWETKNPEIDHNAKYGGSETIEVACTSISIDDHNNDHNLINYKSHEIVQERNIIDDKSTACMDAISPSVVDVNNVAQNCSCVTTQEASTSKFIDDQANSIDMIDHKCEVVEASNVGDLKPNDSQGNDCGNIGGHKFEEVITSSNTKDVKPDACLDAMFSPPKNVDIATGETVTEIGPSTMGISVDNINDYDMTGYKSEEVVDINNAMGTAPIDSISPSLLNMDIMTHETDNEIDLSSCTMIPEIGKHGTDKKVNSESHLITISGNESSYGIETYANDILASSMEENILGELDTSGNGLKTEFAGCHSLSDKQPVMENIMADEFNASCTDTTFVSGHTGAIEADAHCMFDIDMKESVVEEMDKPGNVLENCFGGSNAGCEEVVLSDGVANNDGTNSLQGNVTGTSSWVHSADGVPILDMIPKQCEDELSSAGRKHENLPGAANSSEFVRLAGLESISVTEPSIEMGYATELQNGTCPSAELGWDVSPKMVIGCQLTSVCVWCSREFSHDGCDAEPPSDSLGFMCPACKAKILGQFSKLDDDSSG